MNTARMGEFLAQVSQARPTDLIAMVFGRGQFAQGQGPGRPGKYPLVGTAALRARVESQEHVWDELREKEFPNRVFHHLMRSPGSWKLACPVWLPLRTGFEDAPLCLG